MNAEALAELLTSVRQALDHAQGKRELRTTVLPPVPAPFTAAQVRRLRRRLNASQAVFARYLNVSTKLVQAWESERRRPDGPALVLLRLGERDPVSLAATAFGVERAAVRLPASRGKSTRSRPLGKRRKAKAA
jgi:putative transcriptional regulator